jgi:hypothetical protein
MEWLRGEFGVAPLNVPVILPTSEYFPPPFSGSDGDVRAVVRSATPITTSIATGDRRLA